MNLSDFTKDIQKSIEEFEKLYKEKHEQNPDFYPLELSEDNAGLWCELFDAYLQGGDV